MVDTRGRGSKRPDFGQTSFMVGVLTFFGIADIPLFIINSLTRVLTIAARFDENTYLHTLWFSSSRV